MRIEIRGLSKVHPGGVNALSGVDMTIERGLHGLLGPNGAGKTTLMRIACTLLEPTSGSILVDGRPLEEDRGSLRRRLGYLGQEWGAPRSARCSEVLDLVLRLRGVLAPGQRAKEIERLLGIVGLTSMARRKVSTLSGGMQRRLGVAQALAGDPELIVMDEPTVGLDPDERVDLRNLLSWLGRERTILLSTHIVADVGTTCGSVTVLSRGRVVFEGAPEALAETARGRVFEVLADRATEDRLRETATVVASIPTAAGARVRIIGAAPPGVASEPAEPNLEDAYLLLVPDAGGSLGAEVAA